MNVRRSQIRLAPDPKRVIIRPFDPAGPERTKKIIDRVLQLSEEEVEKVLEKVKAEFAARHRDVEGALAGSFERIRSHLPPDVDLSAQRGLLLGSYFTHEYSIESAALFNPSIVPHPDQRGVPVGLIRVVLSLRATGEGHISSLEFRTGVLTGQGELRLDPPGRFAGMPELIRERSYEKSHFLRKLQESGLADSSAQEIFRPLPETFSLSQLEQSIGNFKHTPPTLSDDQQRLLDAIHWLAEANYEVRFEAASELSERVIFPISSSERNGIEDARFVRFFQDDGSVTYYATYTAYDGWNIRSQLLETKDFMSFRVRTLSGKAVENKGMALFPRKLNGKYAMISRQDGENLYFMISDTVKFWNEKQPLLTPTFPWEFIQIGNCGSPIETEKGWLLLTHGVGPLRKYCIGAILLDLHDPSKVISRLKEPLLEPVGEEREGYVPNVVYTCGALLHNNLLIIPYAMSDYMTGVASVPLNEVLNNMV